MKIVKKKISDLKPAECCCGVVLMHHNGSGIYAGREFMFVSPMPEPMPNKDKND